MDTPENRETPIRVHFGAGLHAAAGQRVDDSAYYQYIGRWSRLFVPAVLAAAEVTSGDHVLESPPDQAKPRSACCPCSNRRAS